MTSPPAPPPGWGFSWGSAGSVGAERRRDASLSSGVSGLSPSVFFSGQGKGWATATHTPRCKVSQSRDTFQVHFCSLAEHGLPPTAGTEPRHAKSEGATSEGLAVNSAVDPQPSLSLPLDRFIGLKMKSVTFIDSLFEECYFEDVTSSNTFFRNCTFLATVFYNTGNVS